MRVIVKTENSMDNLCTFELRGRDSKQHICVCHSPTVLSTILSNQSHLLTSHLSCFLHYVVPILNLKYFIKCTKLAYVVQ